VAADDDAGSAAEVNVAGELTAAVISYATREHLPACLCALEREPVREVIVVDNASPDGSAEVVRSRYPSVTLIANRANVGYGAAANQAVAAAGGEYVLLLNGDAVPEPGAVSALARYLDEHARAAVVGPQLRSVDGSLQPSCYPFLTPLNVLMVMSGLNGLIAWLPGLRAWHLPTSAHDIARPVPWVKGAALAIRKSAFDAVGGFDESFFLYSEEQDLSYRLAAAGWETHFAPVAVVRHVERASSPGREDAVTEQIFRSLIHFYRRHYSWRRLVGLRFALAVLMSGRIGRDAVRLAREREAGRRRQLRRDIALWRRVLLGRLQRGAASGL
jgi:N-acetylglucosaminyl-diphospho-decaprenol L-rhamnosyltransferase